VPCQDAPGAKFTYSATVRCPDPLTALMSAVLRRGGPVGGYQDPEVVSVPPAAAAFFAEVEAAEGPGAGDKVSEINKKI
jgi:hypothetical protein